MDASNPRVWRLCQPLYRVRSAATCRVVQAARSHHKQSYRKHGFSADTLVPPMTLSPLLVARSTMQMATIADLRCHSVASFATYQSAGSPLRLSGDSPDNRSGGAVRFNVSQRAGCEGARESLGSHAASLNKGW